MPLNLTPLGLTLYGMAQYGSHGAPVGTCNLHWTIDHKKQLNHTPDITVIKSIVTNRVTRPRSDMPISS